MKKLALILGSFILINTLSAQEKAQFPAQTTPEASTSLAEITFETESHDFGVLEYGGNGTYDFKFKNTGKEPLIISNAQGSCGCTVPTYPKNVPIKPGETQIIKVTYDTKRPGVINKSVTVTSNAKTSSKILTIKGKVEPAPVEEAFPANGTKQEGSVPLEKH